MMVYLGNLTVSKIESDGYGYGLKFTDGEREYLNKTHHPKAHFEHGDSGWHMFDIPRFLVVSPDDVGERVVDIFKGHCDEIHGSISVAYAYERDDAL